jgi:glucosylglycerate synthase
VGRDFKDELVETDSISQPALEETKQIDSADLVVGILTELDSEAMKALSDALRTLPGSLRIAVLQSDDRHNAAQIDSASSPVFFVPSQLARPNGPGAGPLSLAATYQSIFAAGEKMQSRGCCIIASKLESTTPERASRLARPLLEAGVDLVVPCYARRRFQGLLSSAIIAPLMRSLYGKRLSNPMGPDFGVSRRLIQKIQGAERGARAAGNGLHPLASLVPAALCENLHVAEVHFGTRVSPPPDWTNTSSLLAEVLGPVFLDVERNAACWQRTRVSVSVPTLGDPVAAEDDTGSLDTTRLLDSFALANRELQEIWGLVLPPATLFELRKLSRLPPEQFRIPDETWARIVYDFALAHRLRTINRDHLLKSMTPLYLGWVASYAHDLQMGNSIGPDQRLERLALAFEAEKPYLVSRWRWPDRFNP